MKKGISYVLFTVVLLSCAPQKDEKVIAAFEVYCEMVASSAKPIALNQPMEGHEVDLFWDDFQAVAKKHQVSLYREDSMPSSGLFPAVMTEGKTIVVIYRGDRYYQYQQWKQDAKQTNELNMHQQEALARRFGRLLGYSPQGINNLLAKNTTYRNLQTFDVKDQITHLYYNKLNEAVEFYKHQLGLPMIDSTTFKIGSNAFIELHMLNDEHTLGEPKSTAVALLTDQLPEWYAHVLAVGIPIKYTYKPREGGPHDGFVAIDPGGYLLEFEEFKQHPENELFIAVLEQQDRVITAIDNLSFFGSITWTYHKDMLKMENFYNDVLGHQLVADQGWTKIYQTSTSGFIGLVDERRGMENYAETKAVEIEWSIANKELFDTFASEYWKVYQYNQGTFQGPEKYIYHLTEMK